MEDENDGQNLIKGAYKVTKSLAETKSTIIIPHDEEDVSLKFVVILVNTKLKNYSPKIIYRQLCW